MRSLEGMLLRIERFDLIMVAHHPGTLPDTSARYTPFQGALHQAGLPAEVVTLAISDRFFALVAQDALRAAYEDHTRGPWGFELLTDLTEEPPASENPGPIAIYVGHAPGMPPRYLHVYTTMAGAWMSIPKLVVIPSHGWSEPVAGREFMMTRQGVLVRRMS